MVNKIWSSHTASFDTRDGGPVDIWNDTHAPVPGTLLRSLIWVSWAGYAEYTIGAHGIPKSPVGYGFADLNSQANFDPWTPADDGFEIHSDLLAFDIISLHMAPVGWPPNVSGTLSGSINEIDSSGEIVLTENVNTFMYASGTSFVDSHGQRLFSEEPQFGWAMQTDAGVNFNETDLSVQLTWRGLWLPR